MKRLFLANVAVILLLSGCWDSRNMEDVTLNLGIGVDVTEEGLISVLNQVIVPPAQQGGSSSYNNVIGEGPTFHAAIRDITTLEFPVFSQHQSIAVFNEGVLRGKRTLESLINQMIRDDHVRRSSLVLLTNEPTKEVLVAPDESTIPARFIAELFGNRTHSSAILKASTLSSISSDLQEDLTFPMQMVVNDNGSASLSGSGIFKKGHLLKPLLNEQDNVHLNWLSGELEGGIVVSECNGDPLTFEILEVKVPEIKPTYQNGHFHFHIHQHFSGRISENWDTRDESFSADYLQTCMAAVKKTVEDGASNMMERLQKEYKADAARLYLEAQLAYPKLWQQIRDDWDDVYFANASFDYELTIEVIDLGAKASRRNNPQIK
ncbi:Ger(x)C family spore germination protein [Shouchella clausii]|uniref:Spore germination protein n=4 Tax=Shouchella TaxID=2893057 RepID=Q5WGE7_SHOC1|nr:MULTISPECIES: Ger(x)C family spore germination protein [Shouchella]MCM3312799.1 Ger(x)C family spore germination protein [Psychrobacillus sp. MER TA 17]ALA55173.1 Spore germination protein A3 precursor [Shouchella clausii]KKI84642.1 hypothetical protein WZ76_19885 [Shouchella clausii]MBU3231593.1 Ger(x)C family spore germination protein [Shouchella clausii]MBU3265123.1 Ger(x)C family spore germination protein [Shouchella clausii]